MNFRFPEPFQSVPHAVQSFPHHIRRASPRTRWIAALGFLALVAIILWALWGVFFPPAPRKGPPPPVRIGIVTQRNVAVVEHTIGTVTAYSTVQLTAQVAGKLLHADFSEGQFVHAGQLLFQIDPRPFQAALEQARAQLAKDQAQLVSLRADEKRFNALAAQGAASAQQRDQAVAAAKGAAANVQSDKAAVDTAKLNLGYTQIRSPINGKTGAILIQPGNLVSADGTNPLVVITQVKPIKVSFFLPQKDLPRIQQQMRTGRLEAAIPMPGAAGGQEKATVDFVGNTVSAQTGTIELRADFPNTDLRLVPGQIVKVGATLNTIPNAIMIPGNAVNVGLDDTYVFVVNKQSRAMRVPVTVLYDTGTEKAVRGALSPGARVVTEGQLRLTGNMPVTVMKGKSTAVAVAPGAQ